MADKKISQLNTATAVYDTDDFALVQDAETKQVNASTVKAYVKDGLSKSDVGLGNVDNTSDANKPVSTATQTALDLKQDAATAVTLTGTQTLTNKTISGANNTLSNIGNSSLTNSSITFGSTSQALGSTVSAINAVSLGQSTPAAGAFTTLSSTGNTTLGDAAGDTLTINAGTISIPNGQIPTVSASQAEMEAGTESALRSMSPLRVRQAIIAVASAAINSIGTMGAAGFGVGICPRDSLPAGFNPLPGYDLPSSDNYGNYQYLDGSVMVWVPAFYYKWGTGSNGLAVNVIDIKAYSAYADVATANAAGYALHRAFYDGGAIKAGFFIDKYQASNNGGIASSLKMGNPLSSNSAHNPFSGLTGTPANFYYGAIAAAKTRGAQFFPTSRFIHAAMAMLSYAHAQASSSTTYCAWYGSTTNYPKGNNNNALRDTNDTSVIWVSDGYSNAGKTGSAGFGGGSGNVFAKSTHNGQNCGVADLNGNMWEINLGITSDGTNFYILNTAVAMKNITSGNTLATDAWGATGIAAMYTSLGATYQSLAASNTVKNYGSASQVLSAATSGNDWNAAGAGVPLSAGTGGSNAFGSDGLWDYRPNEMCPVSGGLWGSGSNAGVWALGLNPARGTSLDYVGFRSATYP